MARFLPQFKAWPSTSVHQHCKVPRQLRATAEIKLDRTFRCNNCHLPIACTPRQSRKCTVARRVPRRPQRRLDAALSLRQRLSDRHARSNENGDNSYQHTVAFSPQFSVEIRRLGRIQFLIATQAPWRDGTPNEFSLRYRPRLRATDGGDTQSYPSISQTCHSADELRGPAGWALMSLKLRDADRSCVGFLWPPSIDNHWR